MSDERHEVIDAEEVDPPEPPQRTSTALEPTAPIVPASPTVTPQVEAVELSQRLDVIREAMDNSMVEGIDYGVVPGTDKPALFKAGSEKLSVLFQFDIQPRSTKTWGPGDHLTVETQATVFHMITGARMGYGEGLCTTMERKYRYRRAGRACPECGKEAVIKGKAEYGGGWLCFGKKGGCGAKWDDGDAVIEGQDVGDIENPDLADYWNTVIKMAAKRARVDAVLAVTGASALFTQDLDETGDATGDQSSLPAATEEQKARLTAALGWLLPEIEGRRVWGEIKQAFGGELYGPIAEAVMLPIRARKEIQEDEERTNAEVAVDDEARRQAAGEAPDAPAPDDDDQRPPSDDEEPTEAKPKGAKGKRKGKS